MNARLYFGSKYIDVLFDGFLHLEHTWGVQIGVSEFVKSVGMFGSA